MTRGRLQSIKDILVKRLSCKIDLYIISTCYVNSFLILFSSFFNQVYYHIVYETGLITSHDFKM